MDAFSSGTLPHPFFAYTAEVLSWRLGSPEAGPLPVPVGAAQTELRAGRILRAATRHTQVVLLGLGSGDLAAALAAHLPAATSLTVVSLHPEAAQGLVSAGRLSWLAPAGRCQLLADSSPQAACHLLLAAGFSPDSALTTVNPEPAGPLETRGLAQLRRLLTASRLVPPLPQPSLRPEMPTLALLARPEEPRLDAFFRAARGLAGQAVIVWDAAVVPEAATSAALLGMPVTHLARPLDNDFAAQRNALLAACPPGWVLTLDPDERPGPGFGASAARIMATPGLGGAYFPRLTLYPDPGRAKVGHGLWPDWQLRLFRRDPASGPRYVRPLHERLEGVSGHTVLALDAPILHHNRLVADSAAVTGKLAAFSRLPGATAHRLNADYPSLPLDFLTALSPSDGPGRLFVLPWSA
ncbi:hypothetical protein [Desulfovibrio sp. TomC]|uniref:hypothetical protein n=1 Tax=Desulfovibrio sp. TomC TaxID=1562888 RepID=UPI0005751AF7|nr:hypothetical protein [Desulfovibrio sp. TomC]KHK02049.1 hypothetical protein NY78_2533 [Desulfovibrio sp. TomC]